jgi:hypothetical protein
MAHSLTVNATVARVRNEADIKTGAQADSIATDTEIIEWLDRAYRELVELVASGPGVDLLATSATFTPSAGVYTLPAGVYRVLGIDLVEGTLVTPLTQWNWRDRGRYESVDPPAWRVTAGGVVSFLPTGPSSGTVRLWYVPVPTTLAAGGSFEAYNGWDDYLVTYAVVEVRAKQEYDTSRAERRLAQLRRRVLTEAARLRAESTTVPERAGSSADSDYYNG